MKIRNLEKTSIEELVACLVKSFEGYFVPMPSDVGFWETRFKNARMNPQLSWGVFDDQKLVGFIVNGIDVVEGALTAFNTGTGVLPEYRGNQWVDQMYAYGIPHLVENGVTQCSLEVITKNVKAIRVYERVGFEIQRQLKCYKGTLIPKDEINIQECQLDELGDRIADHQYSWDNQSNTIRKAGDAYKTFKVFEKDKNKATGHFIMNPQNGYIAQLESYDGHWKRIFEGISYVSKDIRMNNVHEERKDLLDCLNVLEIENVIDQYFMEMKISN